MTIADIINEVDLYDATLTEATLGYDILVQDEDTGKIEIAGGIEAVPGHLEYLFVHPHWRDKGVARVGIDKFIGLSKTHGYTTVVTTNVTNPAMKHILETEGFEKRPDKTGWQKEIKI